MSVMLKEGWLCFKSWAGQASLRREYFLKDPTETMNLEEHSRQKEKELQFALSVFRTRAQGTMKSPVLELGSSRKNCWR